MMSKMKMIGWIVQFETLYGDGDWGKAYEIYLTKREALENYRGIVKLSTADYPYYRNAQKPVKAYIKLENK